VFAGVADTGNKLSSVLLLPVVNYRCCRCYQRLIIASAVKLTLVSLNQSGKGLYHTGDVVNNLSPVSLTLHGDKHKNF
jgi:hypothetical protein